MTYVHGIVKSGNNLIHFLYKFYIFGIFEAKI